MAQNLNKTKRRITSINSTKKITKAMELVSTVKLRRYKNVMLMNESYANEIADLINSLLSSYVPKEKDDELSYLKNKKSEKTLYVVITSNLGLCAGYNNEVYHYIERNIPTQNSELLIVGQKGDNYFKKSEYSLNDKFVSINEKIIYEDIVHLGNYLLNEFKCDNYKEIKIVYTKYVNSIKFVPNMVTLLPIVQTSQANDLAYPPIYDSDVKTLIEKLLPIYLNSVLYQKIVESEVSEQASRRQAMENANDNADELINNLTLEYNKARQAQITQEINEIVSGQNV